MLGRRRRRARAGRESARRDPRGARRRRAVLVRPARRDRARGRRRAARAVGSRLGRRGDERRVAPLRAERRYQAPRPTGAPRRFSRARAAAVDRDAGPLVARRRGSSPGDARPARARGAPARAAGDRHARRRARRGDPRRLRRGLRRAARARDARARAGAATSSRGSAARSSRSAARSSGCASCGRATATSRSRSCSPRPIRRSRTARRCRGRSARARAPRGSRARTSCCSAARPALFVERGGRSLVPLREPDEDVAPAGARRARRARRSAAARSASRSSASTASPSPRRSRMPLLVEAGFLAGPRRAVLALAVTVARDEPVATAVPRSGTSLPSPRTVRAAAAATGRARSCAGGSRCAPRTRARRRRARSPTGAASARAARRRSSGCSASSASTLNSDSVRCTRSPSTSTSWRPRSMCSPPSRRTGARAVRAVELAPAQDRAHAAQQLRGRERLRHVVVRAELEPEHAVDLRVARGQHQDRHVALGAQRAADLGARELRAASRRG